MSDFCGQVKLPTVLVNARVENLAFATVSTDDAAAAEQAVCTCTSSGIAASERSMGSLDHIPSQRKLAAARRLLYVARRADR